MKPPGSASLVLAAGLGCALGCSGPEPAPAPVPESSPNILLIVADDLGYSDLGSYGGEIETPALDALAARGLRATGFTVTPACSPTRSILLTGVDNHVAGFGNMTAYRGPRQRGKPGYEGYLNDRVVTIASLLRAAGYHTYMAGKWHLGARPSQWPVEHGFERDFAMLHGSGSSFSDMSHLERAPLRFTLNGEILEELTEEHFSSAAYSEFIIRSIEEQRGDRRPFFALLSFQAVHRPLGAPDEWLAKYRGRYAAGYDSVRARRLARMKEGGLVGTDVTAFPGLPDIPQWDDLSEDQQRRSQRKMEVYAAMLANMDFHIGRVLEYLERVGELDDTLVLFLSDNGPDPVEFREPAEAAPAVSLEDWGRRGSAVAYGPAWAQVSAAPFQLFKGHLTEGGIRSPLIVAGPGVNRRGETSDAILHVSDLVPTLLDFAGVDHPASGPESRLAPLAGKSLRPLLAARTETVRTDEEPVAWELFGNRAVRLGDWKALFQLGGAGGAERWQLFNLRDDPAELRDLSAERGRERDELVSLWEEYARVNGVIYTGDGPYRRRPAGAALED